MLDVAEAMAKYSAAIEYPVLVLESLVPLKSFP